MLDLAFAVGDLLDPESRTDGVLRQVVLANEERFAENIRGMVRTQDGISSLSSESLLSVETLGGAASDEESLSASDEESVGNPKSVAATSWSVIAL